MNVKISLLVGFAAIGLVACFDSDPSQDSWQRSQRLNVLLVTADDLGLQIGSYGEQRIKTPSLDDLVGRSVQFETAYVTQASCSSSRSSLFTGYFPHANGQLGLANHGFALHPEFQAETLPNLLKKAGYRTALIGKLHVDPESSFQFDERNSSVNGQYVRQVGRAAEDFLNRRSSQPFFLMVSYSDPHALKDPESSNWYFPEQLEGLPEMPISASEQTIFDAQQVDTEIQRARIAGYLNGVQRLDAGIGMLLEALQKSGHEEDTLIIFIGDHGPPFCRGKTTTYEFGLRIPFLVSWPGVGAARETPAMVSTVDILPTILDAVAEPIPEGLHGSSLRQVIDGSSDAHRDFLFGEFHSHGKTPFFPRRAVRDSRYKLIHNLRAGKENPMLTIDGDKVHQIALQADFDGTPVQEAFRTFARPPEFELYDLEHDPVEFHNLYGLESMAPIAERLKKALIDWRQLTADPFLDVQYTEEYATQLGASR